MPALVLDEAAVRALVTREDALTAVRQALAALADGQVVMPDELAMVLEGVHGETLNPGPDLDQVIGGVAIGAMEPAHMLQRIGPRSLVIVPGDRTDVIRAIVGAHVDSEADGTGALGMVLTGGYRPDRSVINAIRRANLFATLVPEDTYAVASEVHDLLVKTHASDAGKIAEIKELVWQHLFIDRVLEVSAQAAV